MSYAPPVVYQQGAPNPYGGYPQNPAAASPYPAAGAPATDAGWMGAPVAAAPAPYDANSYTQQQSYQQQPPYSQQQPAYQQQPYPQQAPYGAQQQPVYPQQQQQQQQQQDKGKLSSLVSFGQNLVQQHFTNPTAAAKPYGSGSSSSSGPYGALQHQYMPPTTYSPNPAPGSGRKKALLIGCSYPGTSAALNGCINDVQCIEYCLKHRFGFVQPGSIVVLRDDQRQPDYVSTRANILRGIQWLMQDLRPGDSLFFHFSGHGSQQYDTSGDELDGQDETILPTDYKKAGSIVDDDLNALMVRPLPPGVTLHALIDACHSGTAMDLPYRAKLGSDGRFTWKLKSRVIKGTSGGTAFQFGACKDSQVAADTNSMSGSAYTGAATYSFIDAVERYGAQQTYASLLQHMMETLKKQGGIGGGLPSLPTNLLPGKLGQLAGLAGGLTGGLTGAAVGLVSSFVLGPGALGGQVPVVCCDKQLDLYSTRLAI